MSCFIWESACLNHIFAEIYFLHGLWKESAQVEPLDAVVDQTKILQAGQDGEDPVDVFQVVVVQNKNIQASQGLEQLFVQWSQFILLKTELLQLRQIVKSVSEIPKCSISGQFSHFKLTYLSILDMIFLERFKCLRRGSSERNCFIFDWPDHYSQYLCLPEKQCLARWLMFLSEMVRCRTCFSLRPTSRLTVCWVRTEPWLGSSSGLQRRRSTSNIFSPGWSEKLEHTWQQYHSLWKHGNINTSLGVNVTQMMN